jgi:hypothetical protein
LTTATVEKWAFFCGRKLSIIIKQMKKLFILLLLATFFTGCKDDDNSPTGTDTPTPTVSGTYVGTIGGAGSTSGALSITITQASSLTSVPTTQAATYTVTGTLMVNGNMVVLTGTFDGTTLTISGNSFSFSGTLSNGTLSGTFNGPNGSGSFTVSKGSNGATVKVYTGTISGSSSGTFNIVVNGTSVTGVAVTGSAHLLTGTVSGNSISINGDTAIGSFTNSGNSCTGTWNDGQGGSGTWEGTLVDVSSIKMYVGTMLGWEGINSAPLKIAVKGTTISGIVISPDNGSIITLSGTVSGTQITMSSAGVSGVGIGTFTNSGNNCSGTWTIAPGKTLTWQATLVNP